MFRNYLKIAFRSLRKSKGFTALNIIGLAAGLGVCLLIVLYVTDELSYDRYNVNADRIYRIDEDVYFNNTRYESLPPLPNFSAPLSSLPIRRSSRWSGSATRATCW